jgi:hypothetical protein
MVIGNLTRKERVFDILSDIRDLHTIQDKSKRIQQLESIAESIGELREPRSYEQCLVLNLSVLWKDNLNGAAGYTIADDINRLHDYMEQSLRSKTIRR